MIKESKLFATYTSNTIPLEKDYDDNYSYKIRTETRGFITNTKDLRNDGSFPTAKRLTLAIAAARGKELRKFFCRCRHHIIDHSTSCKSFIMLFLFGEPIPTNGFGSCSVRGCSCRRFTGDEVRV